MNEYETRDKLKERINAEIPDINFFVFEKGQMRLEYQKDYGFDLYKVLEYGEHPTVRSSSLETYAFITDNLSSIITAAKEANKTFLERKRLSKEKRKAIFEELEKKLEEV